MSRTSAAIAAACLIGLVTAGCSGSDEAPKDAGTTPRRDAGVTVRDGGSSTGPSSKWGEMRWGSGRWDRR